MKLLLCQLLVSATLWVVCSSAMANAALSRAIERSTAHLVARLLGARKPVTSIGLSFGIYPSLSWVGIDDLMRDTPTSAVKDYTEKDYAEYVPFQRAVVLRQLGLPLHELLMADDRDFKDAVLMKAMRLQRYDDGTIGDELIDTGLERYLPSVYKLSADDVLDSAEALDDFGDPVQTGKWSDEKVFNFASVVSILKSSLGDTGHRAVIDNLNKLDFDATKQLMHRVSQAWSLRVLQAGSDFEAAQQTGELTQSPLDGVLKSIISSKQRGLELAKERRSKTPFFAPSAGEIEQLEIEVDALKKIDVMSHSPERGTAIVEFHADYLTNSNDILNFTDKDLEWLQRNKIGQAVLQDITPPALAALSQLSELYSSYVPVDLMDAAQRQQELLDLLEKELQQVLAAKVGE